MLELEIQRAMERYHDRLREADDYRQFQIALCASGHGHLRLRLAANLGSWLVKMGRRLGAPEVHPDPSPAPNYSVRSLPQFTVSWSKTMDCGSDPGTGSDGHFRKIA